MRKIFCASFLLFECLMIYVSLGSLQGRHMSAADKMASSRHTVCRQQTDKGQNEHEHS